MFEAELPQESYDNIVISPTDWERELFQQIVTAEGVLLVLNKETGMYSYAWPSLNRITPPSKRLRDYAKRRKSSNPLSYLWYRLRYWLFEE